MGGPQTSLRESLETDLALLGFTAWPVEVAAIRSRYRALIKTVHPDRNRKRPDWAAGRTRMVIEATQRLLLAAQEVCPPSNHGQNFLCVAEAGRLFAVPITHLISVRPSPSVVRRGLMGYYAADNENFFELHTSHAHPFRREYASAVLLFAATGSVPGFALALENPLRWEGIHEIAPAQILLRSDGSITIIMEDGQQRPVPSIFREHIERQTEQNVEHCQ